MKIIKINPPTSRLRRTSKKNIEDKIYNEQIDLIVDYLKRGKVIVYPTDTIYGLGCIATDKKAINKIYKIKKRDKSKPLLILVSSLAMVKKYCYVNKKQEEYLKKVWGENPPSPLCQGGVIGRPVSVILRSRNLLPKELTGGENSIAVRLPKDELLIKIIGQVNLPIVSTSLNISGKKNLTNISEIDKYFSKYKPYLVVDIGELKAKPSKLIDLRDINNIKILRK